jgi:hypothetical protein
MRKGPVHPDVPCGCVRVDGTETMAIWSVQGDHSPSRYLHSAGFKFKVAIELALVGELPLS